MDSLRQVGALVVRRAPNGKLETLLVTSRETGRWIIPKGWRAKRRPDHEAAAREAKQEGGIIGEISDEPIGHYTYFKRLTDSFRQTEVAVFLLIATHERDRWREQHERRRIWVPLKDAARMVQEPSLAGLMRATARSPRLKALEVLPPPRPRKANGR
jgi:8-oxo-dGTP pyrophosphatase MutT (NUDIX family)